MLQQIQIAAPCPVSSETGFFLQPTGGDEIPDGAPDGGFGQTRVARNGRNGWKADTVLVAPLAEVEVYRQQSTGAGGVTWASLIRSTNKISRPAR